MEIKVNRRRRFHPQLKFYTSNIDTLHKGCLLIVKFIAIYELTNKLCGTIKHNADILDGNSFLQKFNFEKPERTKTRWNFSFIRDLHLIDEEELNEYIKIKNYRNKLVHETSDIMVNYVPLLSYIKILGDLYSKLLYVDSIMESKTQNFAKITNGKIYLNNNEIEKFKNDWTDETEFIFHNSHEN